MKKKLTAAAIALATVVPTIAAAEECDPTRWTVTLEHLEPLSDEGRQFILGVLGIDLSPEIIEQAIQENQIPLEAFGGE